MTIYVEREEEGREREREMAIYVERDEGREREMAIYVERDLSLIHI